MPLQILQYSAGIVKDITPYSAGKQGPFWVDGNLVRFKNGYVEKIGGWQLDAINKLSPDGSINDNNVTKNLQGIARKILFWRSDTTGEDYIAVGTHNHLYIVENGFLYDITPLRDKTNEATTLTEDLTSGETSIDVASVTGFKTAGTIKIGSEVITYTGISTLTLTGCTRGADSSTATTHSNGASVTQILIDPIATSSGSKTVTITDSGHGAKDGDYVRISGSAAVGGVTADSINDYYGYPIDFIDANSYSIEVPDAATSTVSSGGGNDIVIEYLIGKDANLGFQSSDPALGWGIGGWGNETWGTARAASESDVSLQNSSWTLNIWSEDLIATLRGGAIYYWDVSAGVGNRASLVSSLSGANSVPSVVQTTIVSFPDRHFIAGGAQAYAVGGGGDVDNMLVRWSNIEDFKVFQPKSENSAGFQRLQIGTKIISMVSAREETIISTDEAIYGMTFVGDPFIFSFRLLARDAGACGLNSMINIDGNVFWMGRRNFFGYDGIVKELPCPVEHFVFNRMQIRYLDKVVVGHNKKFKEIIWFYVSEDNTAGTVNPEPDSYVIYNYAEKNWSIGTMDRTCWHDSFGSRTVPFAFDSSGLLYDHETGTSDNGSAMNCFIEGSPRELTVEGDNLYMVDKIVPDATMTADTSLNIYLKTRKYPNASETTKGPFTVTSSTEKVSTRAKGRQISLKIESTGSDDSWTLGDFRYNSREDGLR